MASAVEGGASREIQVSSALWERAVQRDPVAVGILAHEMAHLAFRDGRLLRPMDELLSAARGVLGAIALIVLATAVLATVTTIAAGARGAPWGDVVMREAAVFAFTALVLLIPALANLIVRRQASLVTALVEIRADACAGLWTGGLTGLARALSADPALRASSIADVRHSLLSPELTHVSNSERIALLSDVAKLTTPKLRYFALSIALPFLVPLNPYTPLLTGGTLDQLMVTAVVVAAHVSAIAMIVLAAIALPVSLSWRQAAMLGSFLCLVTMLPRINLYEIGYLLANLAARLVLPGGFGADPATWTSVASDIAITLGGLGDKLAKASGGGLILLAVLCSSAALRGLSLLSRHARSQWPSLRGEWLWMLPATVAAIVAIASTHDEWRSPTFPPFALAAVWASLTKPAAWINLCAPELVALLVFATQIGILRATAGKSAK